MATVKKSIALLMSLLLITGMVITIGCAGNTFAAAAGEGTSEATSTDATPSDAESTPSDAEPADDSSDDTATPADATPTDTTPDDPEPDPEPESDVPVNYDSIKDNEYTVKFDVNGGPAATPVSITKNGGTKITVPNLSEDEDQFFLGWSENPDGGDTMYNGGDEYIVVKTVTLYAIWRNKNDTEKNPVEVYKLTFDANGGTNPPGAIHSSGTISLPTEKPIRKGYAFIGWAEKSSAKKADYTSGGSFNLTKPTTLYAVWETANPTEGVEIHAVSETTVDYLSKVRIVATAQKNIGDVSGYGIDEYESLPEGYVLVITDTDDEDKIVATGNRDEVVLYLDEINRERHFAVTVAREGEGIVNPERDENEVQLTVPVNIRVRDCFLDRLLAAVRKLFGLLPIVYIGPLETEYTNRYASGDGTGFIATILSLFNGN